MRAGGFHPVLQEAVSALCKRFEAADYGVTPIIDLAALVANADGTVDREEEAALLTLFRSSLGRELSPEMVRHLVRTSLQVVEAAGVQARAQLLAEVLLDCDAVEPGLLVALTVAFASEGLSSAERGVIVQIARKAGVGKARLEELIGVVERATAEAQ
jgi:tellurite resistance protein